MRLYEDPIAGAELVLGHEISKPVHYLHSRLGSSQMVLLGAPQHADDRNRLCTVAIDGLRE